MRTLGDYERAGERPPAFRPDPNPIHDPMTETYDALEKASIVTRSRLVMAWAWCRKNPDEAILRAIVTVGAISGIRLVIDALTFRLGSN